MKCPNCKKMFTPKPNGNGGTKSCSYTCAWKLQTKKQKRKTCGCCKKKFWSSNEQQKYCSTSCGAIKNNQLYKRSQNKYFCTCCNTEITGDNRKFRKFCSRKCELGYKKQERVQKILKRGRVSSNVQARKVLLFKTGHVCAICGVKKWCEQPVGLVVDHIDGNSENNKLTNLRLVCGNCDMQLPTYKGKNRGKGRAWRRERYARGQSY